LDTDDLTEMAYRTIILADEATDVLKCELGIALREVPNRRRISEGGSGVPG
jgi:hypothetical protein